MFAKALILALAVGASYCKEHHHALKTIVRHEQPKEYIHHVPEYASLQEPAPIYELQYQTESQEQGAQSQVAHHEPADHEIQLSTAKQPAPAYHYAEQEEHKPVHFHHGISLQSLYKQAAAHQAPASHQYQSHHEPSHYESHYSHDEQSQHAPQHHVASHHAPSHHAAHSDDQSHHAPQDHVASHHVPSHHAAHSDDLSHQAPQHHVASHHVPSHHAAHSEESHEEPIDYYAHPKYQYEYKVEDPHTGDNKFQHEVRDGDYVKGVYSFAEADGSIRTVEYTSDKHHGFNAVVKHTAPRPHQHQHGHEHHQN